MTDAVVEPGKLDIGSVIGETFGVIGRNFLTFFLLSLLLSGLPSGIIAYIQAGMTAQSASGIPDFSGAYIGGILMGAIGAIITAMILQGAIIYATVQDMNGARPSVPDSLTTGLRAFLPLLGFSILFGFALAFGFILLIVPGFMMLCAWCVAAPALVAERTGVFGAFSRSADLTRNNRWRIFGLLVIVWIIAVVISAVIGGVMVAVAIGQSGLDPVAMARHPANIFGQVIINALSSMVTTAGVAVLYVQLRKAREGLGPQWLSEIFS